MADQVTEETPAGDPVPKLDSSNVVDFCNNSNSILTLPGVLRSDIHNVDDIIYAQFGIPDNYFIGNHTDLSETRVDMKMDFDRLVVYLLDMCRKSWEIPDQVWLTYFKLLHHSSESDFKDMGIQIIEILPKLLSSRDIRPICNAIKIIRTITSRSEDLFANYFKEQFDEHHIFIYLECKLSIFPEAFDEKDRRITSWISSQSKLVTEHLMTQHGYNTHGSFQYLQELTTEYIKSGVGMPKIFDVFVTTKKENFHKFVRYFIGELMKDVFNSKFMMKRYYFHSFEVKALIEYIVLIYIGITGPIRYWSETDYNTIANCIGFNIDSYLSGDFDEAKEMNCIRNYYDEGNGDYTILKFMVFDDFVRRVHILELFDREYCYHEDIKKITLKGGEKFDEKRHDLVKCNRNLFFSALVGEHPDHRSCFTWCLKCLMNLCPRVYLPTSLTRYTEGDDLMASFLDVLNNKGASRAKLKQIFYAIVFDRSKSDAIKKYPHY